MNQPYTLYTFAMSHYSEKIRWTLDHSALPYREVCMSPVFHIGPALRMGGRARTTLPILDTGSETIQDSARILRWLEKHHAPLAVLPTPLSDEIHQACARFDAIGKDVARFLYAKAFGHGDEHIRRLWTDHATPSQARFIRIGYPLIRWGFRRKLNITERGAARAQARITEVIDWLEQQLAQGQTYLIDGRFTAADITAAALLAPLACPPQHPVYGDPDYQRTMRDATAPWHTRPALAWVRRLYAEHRPAMQGGVLSLRAA